MGTLGFITIKHFALQQDKKYKYKIWEKYLQTTYLIKTLPCRICKKKKKLSKLTRKNKTKSTKANKQTKAPLEYGQKNEEMFHQKGHTSGN